MFISQLLTATYLLKKDYRLRGWTDYWICLEHFPTRDLTELTAREGHFLMKCNRVREIDEEAFAPEISRFLEKGVIEKAAGGQLLPEQAYRLYENRRFRSLNLSVTGSCDFRCRHCFNAADDSPRGVTPKTEAIIDLIRRMDECGVAKLGITGGEPLLHPGHLRITQEIKDRGMILETMNTNLYHMSPEFPDALHAQGHDPEIYTSFDGIGAHDWLRRVPGSEERTIQQIRLMKKKGFRIHVHTCVWKDSMQTVKATALKMQELNVDEFRITAVEPSVRWMGDSPDQLIPFGEWLAFMTDFLDWWYANRIRMDLDIWGYWYHSFGSGSARIKTVLSLDPASQYRVPFCPDAYQRPYIDCDGKIMTCLGMSGLSKAFGYDWGNVYSDDLHHILRNGELMKLFRLSVGEMKDRSSDCRDCEWMKLCNYGCRAEACAQGNGIEGIDQRICIFFKDGYYDRFRAIAKKYGLEIET